MRAKDQPVFTVITPVYNSGKWVVRAIESLRAQTFPLEKVQHIIIDDGSSDDSVEIVQDYIRMTNHECIFIINEENLGVCITLNKALSYASGEFISYLPDDLWMPHKLSSDYECWQILSSEYGIVHSNFDTCDEDDRILGKDKTHKGATREDILSFLLYTGAPFPGTSVSIRRTVFEKVGTYNESIKYEDVEFWIRCALNRVQFYHNPVTTFIYRQHSSGDNLSNKVLFGFSATIDNIIMRLNLLDDASTDKDKSIILNSVIFHLLKLIAIDKNKITSSKEMVDLFALLNKLQENHHPAHLLIAGWMYGDTYPTNTFRRRLGLINYILRNG